MGAGCRGGARAMTPLEAIFDELDARLAPLILPGGSYERQPSGDPDAYPALGLYDRGDAPTADQETGATRLELTVTVECFAEGSGGKATHVALIDLHARVVKALCGDEGANLGGLVELIEPTGDRRSDIAELAKKRRLGFEQDFLI